MLDVIVVGGGPAGLSAALVLGRACRRVLLLDSGRPRNTVSDALHGFLTRDCEHPAELRRLGREQLARYDTVEVRDAAVADASSVESGFKIILEDGETLACRKLLLATGVTDALPQIRGFHDIYGSSAFHCPYCDGWEWRGRAIAAHGRGEKGAALALELLGWSSDVVLFTDGPAELSAEDRARLRRNGVHVEEPKIDELKSESGLLGSIVLEDGRAIARDAFFFAAPATQSCDIASHLGCSFDVKGSVKTRAYEKTDVPGLYVAGDASRHVELAIVAAAEGAMAAFAINSELLREDHP
jgi:thioredoxin reductase